MTRGESTLSTHLERARIHLLELLVKHVELDFVHIVGNRELFDALLELGDLFIGGGDDEVDGIDF